MHIDNDKKEEIKYYIGKRLFEINFYKPKTTGSKVLSTGMKTIFKEIRKIAVDRYKLEDFKDFYNNIQKEGEFIGADFTYIKDEHSDKGRTIGFLFASYHRKIENGKNILVGKAFPAIRVEDRGKGGIYDRVALYGKFFEFYMDCLLFIQLKKDAEGKFSVVTPKSDKKNMTALNKFFNSVYKKLETYNITQITKIEIYAENPGTYSDLRKWGFEIENIPKPDEKVFNEIDKWDTGELLRQSYIRSLGPAPSYLNKEVTFSVNITPAEWRNYFEQAVQKKNRDMKFYLWENYNFPNSAYKVVIPMNNNNINIAKSFIKNEKTKNIEEDKQKGEKE